MAWNGSQFTSRSSYQARNKKRPRFVSNEYLAEKFGVSRMTLYRLAQKSGYDPYDFDSLVKFLFYLSRKTGKVF